jgi:FkbM family methyltransferase
MVAAHDFSGPDPESVSFTLPPLPSRGHRIDLSYGGLISAFHLPPRDNRPIFALPGVRILAIRLEAGPADAPATVARRHQGQVVEFQRAGVTLRFFVDDPNDSIQAHHDAGEFYEEEEIALLARNLPKGARVLDVGANIGNHSVAFARLMGASRVVPIEVQPRIIALLKLNVHLNDLSGVVDLAHVGVGFGAARGRGRVEIPQAFNPAGGAVVADENGGFEILPGDEVIGGQDFDLIKIDTEGMELEVLAGLEGSMQAVWWRDAPSVRQNRARAPSRLVLALRSLRQPADRSTDLARRGLRHSGRAHRRRRRHAHLEELGGGRDAS